MVAVSIGEEVWPSGRKWLARDRNPPQDVAGGVTKFFPSQRSVGNTGGISV